jgi:hypothetical protein
MSSQRKVEGTPMAKKKASSMTKKLVHLQPKELARLVRPHTGFTDFAEALVEFYRANERLLHVEGLDTKGMLESLSVYQSLRAPEKAAANQLQKLSETRLLHGSTVWSGMLEIYARAVVVGRVNADIGRGIADFEQFMKKKRKPKAKPAPAAVAASPAPVAA